MLEFYGAGGPLDFMPRDGSGQATHFDPRVGWHILQSCHHSRWCSRGDLHLSQLRLYFRAHGFHHAERDDWQGAPRVVEQAVQRTTLQVRMGFHNSGGENVVALRHGTQTARTLPRSRPTAGDVEGATLPASYKLSIGARAIGGYIGNMTKIAPLLRDAFFGNLLTN